MCDSEMFHLFSDNFGSNLRPPFFQGPLQPWELI